MESPKISVIIPVYNGEKFIARAIESVLAQTQPVFEIIVINDGSKDATEKILAQYAGKIIYKTIPNGGVSNARNAGIEMSTGEWIAFLDADDVWYPSKLERQTVFLDQYPSVGFACCNYTIFNPFLAKRVDHFSILKNNPLVKLNVPVQDPLRVLISANYIGTASNVIVKRKVLRKAGRFNTQYRQAEDYDLWLRCAMHTGFLFMSEILLDKDTHETNLTNNQIETRECHIRVLTALCRDQHDVLKQRNLLGDIRTALAEKNYQIGDILFERGEKKAAFGKYGLAVKSSLTARNMIRFLWVSVKKALRTVTGGLISRKNLRKLEGLPL